MFKCVRVEDGRLEYLSFQDSYEDRCSVGIGHGIQSGFIYVDCGDRLLLNTEDVPKLIKALQAAYDYKKGVA